MTNKNLHHLEDYKEFIRHKISENSTTKAYQTLLAKAAGCQKSFLSQALNSHIHLTPDHAAGMVRFWKMDEQDARYFLDLVLYARAGSQSLRSVIEARRILTTPDLSWVFKTSQHSLLDCFIRYNFSYGD